MLEIEAGALCIHCVATESKKKTTRILKLEHLLKYLLRYCNFCWKKISRLHCSCKNYIYCFLCNYLISSHAIYFVFFLLQKSCRRPHFLKLNR
jgi:hypothetical protein